jgi:hypothetical protein
MLAQKKEPARVEFQEASRRIAPRQGRRNDFLRSMVFSNALTKALFVEPRLITAWMSSSEGVTTQDLAFAICENERKSSSSGSAPPKIVC